MSKELKNKAISLFSTKHDIRKEMKKQKVEMTLDQKVNNVISSLASVEKPKSEEEFLKDLTKMEETNANLHQWLSKDADKVDETLRGDKYALLRNLGFEDADYKEFSESIQTQEKIQKKLVSEFEAFLLFFDIEADVEIHNGKMIVKVTEILDNGWLVDDGVKEVRLDKVGRKKLTELFVNNLMNAYDRSGLSVFLSAPLHSKNTQDWKTYGQLIQYLDKLLLADDELNFFND